MIAPDDPLAILDRLKTGNPTAADVELVRQLLTPGAEKDVVQLGKYNVNIGEGKDIHVGDRIYQGASAEAIRDIIRSVLQELQVTTQPGNPELKSADELVQEVRSRLHDDIQRLHGTMPLWGVDHWVPLGKLFVDVNILGEVSSNRRSELPDLLQDFNRNPGHRSLDRMGLGEERERVSGLDVLTRNTNLMVVGKPGSGKTTYLQRVVTECNAGNLQAHRIPVLIRLREFVEDGREVGYSVEQYLERCWRLSDQAVRLVLDEGRSLVLLDGLDEVTGADGQAIAKQIKRFARDYPQVQVIVTCRTQSQESRFERFDYVEVADFNEPQVRAFAKHWFQTVCTDLTVGQAKATAFLEKLFREENKPIRELAITPVLLSLTCAVFHQTGKFYSKRSKLYEEGLELLLEQWDKSREIERDEIYRDLSVARKRSLLSYLAVKKFEQEQYVLFEQAEIEGYIAEFLGIGLRESRGVLRAIEAQHGLLIERATTVWSFSHLTFQEYLVAKYFCEQESPQELAIFTFNRHYQEAFFLMFELLDNADALALEMKLKIDEFLAKDEKSQDFLQWINTKTKGINISSKPSAIRAFYLKPTVANIRNHNLAYAIDPRLTRKVKSVFHTDIICVFDDSCKIILVFGFDRYSYYSLDSPPDSDLQNNLEVMEKEIPSLYFIDVSIENVDQTQRAQSSWIERLRKLTTKNPNSGYAWQFNESQDAILTEYYNANRLLIDCLNNTCSVSNTVKQEIEESLLLSIAEIENRKRGKVE